VCEREGQAGSLRKREKGGERGVEIERERACTRERDSERLREGERDSERGSAWA